MSQEQPPPLIDIEWTAYMNLCHIADYRGDLDLALHYAERACVIKPVPESFFHIGIVLAHMRRFQDAIEIYRKAILMAPENEVYKYNLSFALLSDQQFQEGFNLYDLRFTVEDKLHFGARSSQIRGEFLDRFPKLWDGKEFFKHLYVFVEQGIGDSIHFARYLPLLLEHAKTINAKITFEVQRTIAPLIKEIFPEITVVPRDGEVFPPAKSDVYDAAISICSLGKLYWNKPVNTPYFPSSPAPKHKKLQVGLCWAGYLGYPSDHLRSFKLSEFNRLPLDGIDYHSFQMGIMKRTWLHDEKINLLDCEFPFASDPTKEIFDFRDTKRLIDKMDLIISADTALAHFAGAMGKKVWLLNAFMPDWRWCPNITEDNSGFSYLYPTVRVFTQHKYRDWSGIMNQIAGELEKNAR